MSTACPCCGAPTRSDDEGTAILLAVCDVLVFKALESLGKWIVRAERSRFKVMVGKPWYVAHTIWSPDDEMVSKALKGAWDVVPALVRVYGCCEVPAAKVTEALNGYVHDLAITGAAPTNDELRYRLASRAGLVFSDEEVTAGV